MQVLSRFSLSRFGIEWRKDTLLMLSALVMMDVISTSLVLRKMDSMALVTVTAVDKMTEATSRQNLLISRMDVVESRAKDLQVQEALNIERLKELQLELEMQNIKDGKKKIKKNVE